MHHDAVCDSEDLLPFSAKTGQLLGEQVVFGQLTLYRVSCSIENVNCDKI